MQQGQHKIVAFWTLTPTLTFKKINPYAIYNIYVNVELIRQPKGPNWPTVPPPTPQKIGNITKKLQYQPKDFKIIL